MGSVPLLPPTTVFVVDDHPVVRVGVSRALSEQPGLRVLGAAADPCIALPQLASLRPNVVILDLVFGGTLQLDFIRNCRQQLPDARIVIFTSLDADVIAQMCLQAGADSILQKEREIADLVAEVMRLVSGARSPRADASEAAESHALAQLDLPKLLTAREREIAQLLGQGATIAQISTSLGISKKTAAVHSDNIRRKIGCANSRQMVTFLAKVGGLGVA